MMKFDTQCDGIYLTRTGVSMDFSYLEQFPKAIFVPRDSSLLSHFRDILGSIDGSLVTGDVCPIAVDVFIDFRLKFANFCVIFLRKNCYLRS